MVFGFKSLRSTAIALSLVAGTLVATPAQSEEVYMIRGFLNVFSNGMNQMTRSLRRLGIRASAHSNGDWRGLAANIIKRHKQGRVSFPIIIVGHSLGGVEAPNFANRLGSAGIPTSLVIGLDPGFDRPNAFRRGAKQVINYKIPSGHRYRRGLGFDGSISNINISGVDHVGIDKDRKVQRLVINRIRRKVGK